MNKSECMSLIKKYNTKEAKEILQCYVISRIFLLAILFSVTYFDLSKLFDCEHYINIANNGYCEDYLYAFFPLTPLLIRYLGVCGFCLLNQAAVLGTTYYIYKIAKEQFNYDPVVCCKIWLLSPVAPFTVICYGESIFLFFTVCAYYLYKNKRNYITAGVCLGLSVMTRSTGSILFFVIFGFMFVQMLQKKERFWNIVKMYIPATVISCIYPAYLQINTGSWRTFIDIQYTFWSKISLNIFTLLKQFPKIISIEDIQIRVFFTADFIIAYLYIILIIIGVIKLRKHKESYDLLLYILATVILVTSTGKNNYNPTASYYRYFNGCFTLFFLLPQNKITIAIESVATILISMFLYGGIFFF